MPNLYITEPGARLEIEAGRLVVSVGEDVLISLPPKQVDEVVLVGPVGVTTPALGVLISENIGLLLLSRQGAYRGRLVTERSRNVALRQVQYRRADDDAFCLGVGRSIVMGKIRNSRTVLMRLDADGDLMTQRVVASLATVLAKVPDADDVPALLGMEGVAGRHYFRALASQVAPAWSFSRRMRRPPPDPVNALFSIAYTLLHESCYSALEAVGLDPTVGFLHKPAYGRASLASDLMEEFRPVIADSIVLTMLNKRMVNANDFSLNKDRRGVSMGRDAWRTMVEQYARRLQTTVRPPGMSRSISYRKVLEVQARRLRRVVEGKDESYVSFRSK